MEAPDLQHATMRIYQSLFGLRGDWGGGLVLCCGLQCAQTGAPSAVSIAGGATLAVDADAASMKMALRSGYLDFVVNNLDEALRTLKNEVRQRRPLSVGLIADTDATLAEMVERGVQPDLHLVSDSHDLQEVLRYVGLRELTARGMPQIVAEVRGEAASAYGMPSDHFFAAQDAVTLRAVDAALLGVLPEADIARRRWLQRVPQYLRSARSGGRWIWLADEELGSLAAQGFTLRQPSVSPKVL